ncbi:hypothetical protein KJ845_04440, partial [Patescibacteria group bacterium]|nr:hypothetical protein [Patescibacteria group bacterium]
SHEMRQVKTDDPVDCSPPSERCIDDEVPACRPDVCDSSTISPTVLVKDNSLEITVTGTPPESTINYFQLSFYNTDNLYPPPPDDNPKPIWFTAGTHYERMCYADGSSSGCSINGNSATFTISYDELNHPDLNWGGGYPVNIRVNGYFGLADGGFSRFDANCVESFNMCAPTSPSVPILTSPANGTETGLTVTLDWNGVGSWGEDCGAGVRNYLVYANQFIEATTRRTTTTATSFLFAPTDVGMWYWRVRAYNGAEYGNYSPSRSFCVEGGPYVVWGGWGACSALTHKQSKTGVCSEDCGTDDCVGVPIYEERDCVGTIMGYLFDASTYSTCPPSFSGVPMIENQSFAISGTWPLINLPVGTNASGYYTESVYSPGSYSFDFSALAGAGYVAIPRLSCQGSTADFVTNAETIGRDFGFWRDYGGWWQIIGGDVYGGGGIESIVPVSMPAGERYLIEEDANGNGGLAQYASGGIELGGGAGVYVSDKEWQAESGYGGQDINYEYYMAKMGIFDKTEWDGSSKPDYNPIDGDEIYTHTGDVTIDFSVDSGEKRVFMIDGNVLVDSNVTVALGSHLAVISSGIITFADNVGEVHGWWVGDRIVIESTGDEATDLQFRGEGSFVGWDAVEFNRDRGLTNNTAPAEEFIYRPDLMVNAPDSLKFSRYIWREMVP